MATSKLKLYDTNCKEQGGGGGGGGETGLNLRHLMIKVDKLRNQQNLFSF